MKMNREGILLLAIVLFLWAGIAFCLIGGYYLYQHHGRLVKVERLAACNREYLDWLGDKNVEQWKFNQKVIDKMRKDGRWGK